LRASSTEFHVDGEAQTKYNCYQVTALKPKQQLPTTTNMYKQKYS